MSTITHIALTVLCLLTSLTAFADTSGQFKQISFNRTYQADMSPGDIQHGIAEMGQMKGIVVITNFYKDVPQYKYANEKQRTMLLQIGEQIARDAQRSVMLVEIVLEDADGEVNPQWLALLESHHNSSPGYERGSDMHMPFFTLSSQMEPDRKNESAIVRIGRSVTDIPPRQTLTNMAIDLNSEFIMQRTLGIFGIKYSPTY